MNLVEKIKERPAIKYGLIILGFVLLFALGAYYYFTSVLPKRPVSSNQELNEAIKERTSHLPDEGTLTILVSPNHVTILDPRNFGDIYATPRKNPVIYYNFPTSEINIDMSMYPYKETLYRLVISSETKDTTPFSVENLSSLPNLSEISFQDVILTSENIEDLSAASLRVLAAVACDVPDISFITQGPLSEHIESAFFSGSPITSLPDLSACPQLESLELIPNAITDYRNAYEWLAGDPNRQFELSFADTQNITEPSIPTEDILSTAQDFLLSSEFEDLLLEAYPAAEIPQPDSFHSDPNMYLCYLDKEYKEETLYIDQDVIYDNGAPSSVCWYLPLTYHFKVYVDAQTGQISFVVFDTEGD